jgi:hypothetical protein
MHRYGLRDDQWDRIKDRLPGRQGSVGVTAVDNRLFVEAVLYRYRAFRGAIYRNASVIGKIRIGVSAAGQNPGCGSACSSISPPMLTTSMG